MTYSFPFRGTEVTVGFSLKEDGWLVQAAALHPTLGGVWFWHRWFRPTLAEALELLRQEGYWKPTV